MVTGARNRAEPEALDFTTPPLAPADVSDGAAPIATVGRADSAVAERASDPGVVSASSSDWREITIPKSTRLPIILETSVESDTSRVEEAVQARIARTVTLSGEIVLPEGSPGTGGGLVGAIIGGKKGAAVGTAMGGGARTTVVLSTRGREVCLARGAALTFQLSELVTVRIRAGGRGLEVNGQRLGARVGSM